MNEPSSAALSGTTSRSDSPCAGSAERGGGGNRARRAVLMRVVLGSLLLAAACLKAHAVWTGANPSVLLFSSPRWEMALVEIEALLGLWLLGGWWMRFAWAAALGFFCSAAAASFYLALNGQASCGCLGQVEASPWLTFGLDLAAVAALLLSRPTRPAEGRPAGWLQGMLATVAGTAVLLALLGGAFLLLSDTPANGLALLRGEPITVEPTLSRIGEGLPGEERSFTIRLTNHGKRPICIWGGTENCSCLATADLPLTVSPGESRLITVQMSFRPAPGRFDRDFVLYTDDPSQLAVTARFSGRVTAAALPLDHHETVGR